MNSFPNLTNGNRFDHHNRESLLRITRRLLADAQALSSRIAAVNEIATAINRSLNLEEILRVVGKQAKWLLDFEHCSVCLRQNDGTWQLMTLFGPSAEFDASMITEEMPLGRALTTGQSQLIRDGSTSVFLNTYSSQLIIPLGSEPEILGTINFATTQVEAYSQEDLRIGYLLALQLASAVRNASCFAELHQLYTQINSEKGKCDQLLLNVLPLDIADELKRNGKVKPVYYDSASVIFTDFKNFTKIAECLPPQELVDELDYCFSYFDQVVEAHNLEKLKTIGDSYMCVAGVPNSNGTHALDAVLAALQIQAFMRWRQLEKTQNNQPYWEIRIGIHSGPLLAGVIGQKKFSYDVWGDTVNTASRMESSGVSGQINISKVTYESIKYFFECEYRGKISTKNKGEIDMYLVSGLKKNFSLDTMGLLPNDDFNKIYSTIQ